METKHAEAYHLMTYRCLSCGKEEVIWNSRDGVTPFMVICRWCHDGTMEHIDWGKDIVSPDYLPPQGSLAFIDMPESLKRSCALKSLLCEGEMPDSPIELEKQIGYIAKTIVQGSPYLIRIA